MEAGSQLPEGDLIVACDGVSSRLRQLYAGDFGTDIHVGRNKYIWLGTSKVFDKFTFAFVPTAAGWIWCHAYGFDVETSTFIVECSPETWSELGFDRLGEHETVALLEQIFASQLEGHRLHASDKANGASPWRSFRTLTNETWHRENIVLMGDAAHTTSPSARARSLRSRMRSRSRRSCPKCRSSSRHSWTTKESGSSLCGLRRPRPASAPGGSRTFGGTSS